MSIIHSRIMPVFVMGALLIGVPGLVYAEPNEGMHRGYRSEHHQGTADRQHMVSHTFHSLLRHAKELGLSEQQVAKLKSLMTDYKKARIRDKAEVKLAEVDAQMLAHDQKAEMSAIEDAVRKAEAARTKLRLDGIRTLREALATLTPEQREKWRSGRAAMHAEGESHGVEQGEAGS
jgi:protein CpxP